MADISIITCVSDTQVYQECLLDSVNRCRNDHDIEIMPILNKDGLYSASLALNLGLNGAKSDIIVIAHQDVSLKGDWFSNAINIIGSMNEEWAIIGAAGIMLDATRKDIGPWGGSIYGDTIAVGRVWHSKDADEPYWNGDKGIHRVHCVDECLFILNKKTGLKFDTAFTGFHFYGADLCLQARAAGYAVYAADLPIIHHGTYSNSMMAGNYWHFLRMLHSKWCMRFPELLGTYMHWSDGELTSYIPMDLESDTGTSIHVKSLGIIKATFTTDTERGIRYK